MALLDAPSRRVERKFSGERNRRIISARIKISAKSVFIELLYAGNGAEMTAESCLKGRKDGDFVLLFRSNDV